MEPGGPPCPLPSALLSQHLHFLTLRACFMYVLRSSCVHDDGDSAQLKLLRWQVPPTACCQRSSHSFRMTRPRQPAVPGTEWNCSKHQSDTFTFTLLCFTHVYRVGACARHVLSTTAHCSPLPPVSQSIAGPAHNTSPPAGNSPGKWQGRAVSSWLLRQVARWVCTNECRFISSLICVSCCAGSRAEPMQDGSRGGDTVGRV